jgi:hypothetical protein
MEFLLVEQPKSAICKGLWFDKLKCLIALTNNSSNFLIVYAWRAPKSRGETHLRVSQSQVAESRDLEARSGFQL